jgi:hypothetical protein
MEIVGDRVTIEVQEVLDHYGDPIERRISRSVVWKDRRCSSRSGNIP